MRKGKYAYRRTCRLCGAKNLGKFLDLGWLPLAGDYLQKSQLGKEKFYPLRVYFCQNCALVQILDVVSPLELFRDYRYLSSVSLSSHFKDYAKEMRERFLKKRSFIVEIGSNDGVLLEPLKKLGMRVLGVEPARNVAKIAKKRGLDTVVDFWSRKLAKKIAKKFGAADAIFANNVLAHINDMEDVTKGIRTLLKPDGLLVFEVHYLPDLIEKLQYDFFYHEHLCYYSLTSLIPFLRRFGMEIFDVKRIPIHSGSIRVYAKIIDGRENRVSKRVNDLLKLEKKMKLGQNRTLLEFAQKVNSQKRELNTLLEKLKRQNKRIVGYGAAGRGNILLNFCSINTKILDYIVDESPERYGRFTPGTHIPIVKPEVFRNDSPDYVLILAWSYKDQILEKEKDFIKRGGKFILPLPKVQILP